MTRDIYISQGEDLDFEGVIKDFAGVVVDLTSINYELYMGIHDSYGTIVKKFANTNGADIAGWESIDVSLGNVGQVTIFLYSGETKLIGEGKYYLETRLRVLDALYTSDDGFQDVVKPREYLFTCLKSVLNSLLP